MGQMLIRTNIEYSRNPDTDPNGVSCNDEKVKVIIASISQSRQEREIIRSTWAKNLTQSVKLVFITSRNNEAHGNFGCAVSSLLIQKVLILF